MNPVWRVRLLIIFLALIAGEMGYLYFTQRLSPEERLAAQQRLQPTPTPVPQDQPEGELLQFSQVVAVPFDLDATPASQEAMLSFININKPGFVTLYGSQVNFNSADEAILDILSEVSADERPLIAVDHEGGTVQRLSGLGFTRLPTWRRVCTQTPAERDRELASSAAELHSVGVQIVFAPVVDVADSNIILKDRICSGDPEQVSEVSLEFIEAFQAQHILPVLKHYPGLGKATIDTHEQLGSVEITTQDTQPFKSLLDRYPNLGVMTAHIAVENQSNKIPCSLSVSCVSQLFSLYPEALVFTDALEMKAALYNYQFPDKPKTLATVAVEALMAGNNVLVFGEGVTPEELEAVLIRIQQEYTSSSEFRTKVNQSVKKIEQYKTEYLDLEETPSELE